MTNTKIPPRQIKKPPGSTRSGAIEDFQPKQFSLEPLAGEWAVAGRFGRVNGGCPQRNAEELWMESEAELSAQQNLAHFRDFTPGADESPDWNT